LRRRSRPPFRRRPRSKSSGGPTKTRSLTMRFSKVARFSTASPGGDYWKETGYWGVKRTDLALDW